MIRQTAEFNAWGRSVALMARHWANKVNRVHLRARGRALNAWEDQSPATFGKVRDLYYRGQRSALPDPLPPWGTTVTVDGITMRIDERMSEHNVRKLLAGRHTRHERDLIAQVLESRDTVMELGGGIGMLAIACAKKVGSGRVFSLEANPRLESLIRDNYSLNAVEPTLRICMLGREAGSRTFYVSKQFSRSSAQKAFADSEPIEMPVEPLNSEIQRLKPTVLVVDIQGGEAELFDYADLTPVNKLLVEVHPDIIGVSRANALRRKLRNMGFAEMARAGQSFLYRRSAAGQT